ncbi:hypothetical protein NM688_g239 [Phlebia brevispora]|uniref:Uncharacterized protein n=1 Tax=Phlebia brevispora TaxID=194682 RepID=A0ACC1TEV0_9APHY|nr:hypothetical protein NM688_g239 [Phlebia brevispora]
MAARTLLRRTMATVVQHPVGNARPEPVTLTAEGAVSISYQTLLSSPSSLVPSIERAFGSQPDCLGIIVVRDLPKTYGGSRERLLRLAYQFANLNECVRERFADEGSRYSFGWSHGKEIMNGRPDTLKGSYYANPIIDEPDVSPELRNAYPEYYGNNIWPSDDVADVKGFEDAFKDVGRFVFSVGCQLAAACQPFASSYLTDSSLSLADLIRSSQTVKARLLHYFPPSPDAPLPAENEPAMYLRQEPDGSPSAVSAPSSTSGLYIRTRGGELTKVSIPEDCLAFQTGEALELATAGKLRATPHCVRVGGTKGADKVSRETFALFMQPNTEQQLSRTENFGQFSKRIFDEHYGQATM